MTNEVGELFEEIKHVAKKLGFGCVFMVLAPKADPHRSALLAYRPDENEDEVKRKLASFIEHRRFVPLGLKGYKNIGPGTDKIFDQIFPPYNKKQKVIDAFSTMNQIVADHIKQETGIAYEIIPDSAVN